MLQDECPTYMDGQDQASVILNAALAAKWWEPAKVLFLAFLGSAGIANQAFARHQRQSHKIPSRH